MLQGRHVMLSLTSETLAGQREGFHCLVQGYVCVILVVDEGPTGVRFEACEYSCSVVVVFTVCMYDRSE